MNISRMYKTINIKKVVLTSNQCVTKSNQQEHIRGLLYYSRSRNSRFVDKHSVSIYTPELVKLGTKEELDQFTGILPELTKFLRDEITAVSPVLENRFFQVFNYNLKNSTYFRGLITLFAYKMLEKPENINNTTIKQVCAVGWCAEMVLTGMIMLDDIMDQSEHRRSQSCWYKIKDVGLYAINDGIVLKNAFFLLLKKYLSGHGSYVTIIELLQETVLNTCVGQSFDARSSVNGKPEFATFTMDFHTQMALTKTAPFACYFPVTAALHLAKSYNHAFYCSTILPILERIAIVLQIIDDFLDCYGNHKKMGKNGSDIRNGKPSYLAVKVLELGTPFQKQGFMQYYGKPDNVSNANILDLYNKMGLPHICSQHIKALEHSIRISISEIPNEKFPRAILLNVLDIIIVYLKQSSEYMYKNL